MFRVGMERRKVKINKRPEGKHHEDERKLMRWDLVRIMLWFVQRYQDTVGEPLAWNTIEPEGRVDQ